MTLADVQNDQLVRRAVRAEPVRLWGLTPTQLHDAAWESHGVQAVRRGSGQRIEPDRRYVLLDRDETVQPSGSYADASKAERRWWKRSEQEARTIPQAPGELPAQGLSDARGFRERVEIDDTGRFIRVQRTYTRQLPPQRGVRITENRKLAAAWASDRAWDGAAVKPGGRFVATSVRGDSRAGSGQLVGDVLHELSTAGAMPDGVEEVLPGVWAHRDACIEPGARFVGPVWIGTNAQIGAGELAMLGSHYVDLCRMILGAEPVDVTARLRPRTGENQRGAEYEDPTGNLTVTFDDGARAFIDFGEDVPRGDAVVTIRGDEGLIVVEENREVWTLRGRSGRTWTFPFACSFRPPSIAARVVYGALAEPAMAGTGRDALVALEVVKAALHSSADSSRVVTLPLDAGGARLGELPGHAPDLHDRQL